MAPLALRSALLLLSTSLLPTLIAAQTSTKCNPTKVICPADPALGTTFNQSFGADSSLSSDQWSSAGSTAPTFPYDNSGMAFRIQERGQAPTIQSQWYTFWGHVSVIMKAAGGQGIISSIVLLSDDLDEIDWEIMGGNGTHVETNYFGKGNASQVNAIYYPTPDPRADFHNYTVNWSSSSIEWIFDGKVLRTLQFDEAVDPDGKTMFPQTPMHVKVGNWAGGDPSLPKGTIEWAGGVTNFNDGPFVMTVKELKVVDGNTNVTDYTYSNLSGNWQSIEIKKGLSTATKQLNAPPPLSLRARWNNLSHTAQIAIAASVIAVVALLILLYAFCCIKARRAGKRERRAADAAWEKEQAEVAAWKSEAVRRQREVMKYGFAESIFKGPSVGVREVR